MPIPAGRQRVTTKSLGLTLAALATVGVLLGMVLVGSASAHTERPSYWPDPRPDRSVTPAAGGSVPEARSLRSAVTGRGPGKVLVVCRGLEGRASMRQLNRSLRVARRQGFRLRPSQDKIHYTTGRAKRLRRINRRLASQCGYHSVQEAVNDAGNNDRVVMMPGRYREPRSRRQPLNDPRCNPGLLQEDASGDETPSYEYQVTCPNDQNLIYLQGRKVGGDPPEPPRDDRRGVPDTGPCIRCNVQMEGSGVRPEDVLLDAGKGYREGKARKPAAKPSGHGKHVVLRVDRADGFVGRNFLMRGGLEFGFYTEETDGILLDRTKFFWNVDYGHLSFTSDHHVVKNCDGFGSGDAVVYPGASPETGSQATRSFWPDAPRPNTVIKRCDLRGSALGYSGSMGNAVRITRNHIYGNSAGIATDTLSSAGHPGFPADSSLIDHNLIYANNFDTYRNNSPVKSLVPAPIGTGILYAGVNDARVHHNWFFDNWREGARLFGVPDALTSFGGAEGEIFPGVSCPGAPENGISTSCGNRFFKNRMGRAPRGFTFPSAVDQFGQRHSSGRSRVMPNGLDFWWEEGSTNTGNCWFDNIGPDGTRRSITGPGEGAPPDRLPSNCSRSVGNGDPVKLAILIDCAEGPDEETGPLDCPWWRTPPKPGSGRARAEQASVADAGRSFDSSEQADALRDRIRELTAAPDGG